LFGDLGVFQVAMLSNVLEELRRLQEFGCVERTRQSPAVPVLPSQINRSPAEHFRNQFTFLMERL
jgi:hypothetical protein